MQKLPTILFALFAMTGIVANFAPRRAESASYQAPQARSRRAAPSANAKDIAADLEKKGAVLRRDAKDNVFALAFVGGDATDEDIASLGILKQHLKSLHLNSDEITDQGLDHIKALAGLEILGLGGASQITDAGLSRLKGFKNLKVLTLGGATKVSDAGLVHVKEIKTLEDLNLFNTRITDAGLKQLARLPKLKKLNVGKTRVTAAGLSALRRKFPDLEIVR